MDRDLVVALLVGALQGAFEWLPISSEGNITVVLAWLGRSPEQAVAFALFLHLGTALSATVYYRGELREIISQLPAWRPAQARCGENALVTFFGVATLVSGVVGMSAYLVLEEVVSSLTGGTVIILIGALLVLTGLFQRLSDSEKTTTDPRLRLTDAVLVGAAQGLAILPGISRSGMTTGTLLLRRYDGGSAFRLSFLLSIPAAVGGGVIAYLDTGLGDVSGTEAGLALLAAFLVGYATIDLLLRVVRRVAFWGVCLGLGGLAIAGGLLVI
jgi:undecaprenyl-diphosphatase